MVTLRLRSIVWFATGAVLAVFATVLVTQAWQADAAADDEDSTFVPVTPCRLFDTRADQPPPGGKKTPLGAGEGNVYTQQVTGSVGNCVGIPAGATAISMNVTIVNPTAQSNLRIYPADAALPTASNLNWLPGQSPTPNKVDVKLSPAGEVKLFNQNGTVNVLADVVGYYTNSTLKELATSITDANAKIAAAEAKVAELEVAGLYAKVDADAGSATLIRGKGVVSVSRVGTGQYNVEFDSSIEQCGWFATLNENTSQISQNGEISVAQDDANSLRVRTFDSTGAAEDPNSTDGFSVHVVC